MPSIDFDALPASARLWIFAADRPLGESDRERVLREVDAFIDQWAAHGTPLSAARDVRYDRFVLIGVDERQADASGCSVDALVRRMRTLQATLGVDLVDNAPVLFRDGEAIHRVSREDFAARVASGDITLDTVVFDNSLARVGDLRQGRWEVRAAQAWHARAFFPSAERMPAQ